MKPITDIDDPRLVKALAHPLRIQILNLLRDRVASPSELADEIGAPLGNVSYHVRFLALGPGAAPSSTTTAPQRFPRSPSRPGPTCPS